jgi:cell division protein FtsN
MFCPKCNLDIEESSDKCPLCDGRLRTDEEVRKRTAQSGSKAGEWTRELILAKAKEILGEDELQEVLHAEDSNEEEKVPSPQEEEVPLEEEKQPSQQRPTLKRKTSGSKKPLLVIGGSALILLALAVLGYLFLVPSKKPSVTARTEVAATKTDRAQTKPLASSKKPPAREQKETTEAILQEPDEKKASSLPEKPTSSLPDEDVKEVSGAAPDISISPALSPRPEGKYSIHVGSFKVKEYAFDLRDRLQNKGYPVLCSLTPIPGKGEWYRVEVGYYSSLEEAQQAASKLESEEKITTFSLTGP